jgi:hypothetical protein
MSKARIVGCKVAELARFVTRAVNIVELPPHIICWGSCQTIILQIIKANPKMEVGDSMYGESRPNS